MMKFADTVGEMEYNRKQNTDIQQSGLVHMLLPLCLLTCPNIKLHGAKNNTNTYKHEKQ